MSDRDRRQLFAYLGGIALLAIIAIGFFTQPSGRLPEIPQSDESSEGGAQNESSVTCYQDCAVSFRFGGADDHAPDESQKEADAKGYSAEQLSYLDLIAQRRMAHWAIILAVLTAIGAGLLIATLYETANATDAANDAAKAAREQLANDRAWILPMHSMETEDITNSYFNDQPFNGVRMVIPYRNFGRTPARKVWAYCDQMFIETEDPVSPAMLEYGDVGDGYGSTPPGVVAGSHCVYIQDSQLALMRQRKLVAFGFARITYRDIFHPEVERVTEYCLQIRWMGNRYNARTGTQEDAFEAKIVPRFSRET